MSEGVSCLYNGPLKLNSTELVASRNSFVNFSFVRLIVTCTKVRYGPILQKIVADIEACNKMYLPKSIDCFVDSYNKASVGKRKLR